MNLDELTVKQVREIAVLAKGLTCPTPTAPTPARNGVEQAVVVCTDKKGVFFGYTTDTTGERITLLRPRMALSWTSSIRGVMGLADTGPDKNCRISTAPPAIELRGITAVLTCSAQAAKAWEESPWIKS